MSVISIAKSHLTTLPYFVGSRISHIPYGYRPAIGTVYRKRCKEIVEFESFSSEERREFIFLRMKSIVFFAYSNVEFYKDLYNSARFSPESLKKFDDLKNIPVITKADLLSAPLEARSTNVQNRELVNTGGSSGATLDLYIQQDSAGHEWAHMHRIWGKLKFVQSDVKIVFAGRSSVTNVLQYDSARHQVNIDIYSDWSKVADSLFELYKTMQPRYLHGYPSAIFDFVLWLAEYKHPLLGKLRDCVDGLFLGSEFPSPFVRKNVEKLLNCKSVSWYGHTERCVLAYEKHSASSYVPFQTYGYCETIEKDGSEQLVGTSFYNRAMPLIRYNTEDLVNSEKKDGLICSFEVTKGRKGEFVLDHGGAKIFLTALVFGRHHKIFDFASQVQIQQEKAGQARIFVVLREATSREVDLSSTFDGTSVKITFSLHVLEKPYVSKSGKVPLLIPSEAVFDENQKMFVENK